MDIILNWKDWNFDQRRLKISLKSRFCPRCGEMSFYKMNTAPWALPMLDLHIKIVISALTLARDPRSAYHERAHEEPDNISVRRSSQSHHLVCILCPGSNLCQVRFSDNFQASSDLHLWKKGDDWLVKCHLICLISHATFIWTKVLFVPFKGNKPLRTKCDWESKHD